MIEPLCMLRPRTLVRGGIAEPDLWEQLLQYERDSPQGFRPGIDLKRFDDQTLICGPPVGDPPSCDGQEDGI